jgi:galactonate dehydratase
VKITRVEGFLVHGEWNPKWNPVIVRIHTDEGLTGLGEVALAYGAGHSAGLGMAKNLAEKFLIGADPLLSEQLWERMFRNSFWGTGGGPVVYGGISAIDEALWDIRGKALNVPVHALLGGKSRSTLRAYASQLQFRWSGESNLKPAIQPEEYAEEALKALAEGYTAVKVDPLHFDDKGRFEGWDVTKLLTSDKLKVIYGRMKAIRDAVGPDVDIILEVHSLTSPTTAIQIARLVEDLNCWFYEEPVNNLNVDAMLKVARKVDLPLAAGERIYTRWGYREYFEKQALDIIQPDLGLVGGITEGKKICDLAHIYDVSVQCHPCGSPVTIACALQLESVIPNFLIHEHHVESLKKDLRRLIKQDLQPEKGYFAVPDGPGLGIELDEEVIGQYLAFEVK